SRAIQAGRQRRTGRGGSVDCTGGVSDRSTSSIGFTPLHRVVGPAAPRAAIGCPCLSWLQSARVSGCDLVLATSLGFARQPHGTTRRSAWARAVALYHLLLLRSQAPCPP